MTSRRLYHFTTSPFARRVRLALAHKKLDVELVDARADPSKREEARRLFPIKTVPLLVEPDGHAIGDSGAILHYLDVAYPDAPALFPSRAEHAREALAAIALADVACDMIINVGEHYFPTQDHPAWQSVAREVVGRAQLALDGLAAHAEGRAGGTWTDAGWGAADAAVFTTVQWIERWPARAATSAFVVRLLSFGVTLPAPLVRWADAHRARPDVVALDAV
jgi:glutathione S-transferase